MPAKRTGMRVLWSALAIADALALAYVATHFDWGLEPPTVGPAPAGWIIQIVAVAVIWTLKALAAAFIAAVGYAIVQDLRGSWLPSRVAAVFVTPVFLAVLGVATLLVTKELRGALDVPAMRFADRLVVFDRLAQGHGGGMSIGGHVVFVCAAIYLGEKYLLRWWRLRWPISVLAIAILAWPAWFAYEGEARQREWVASQQWKPLAERSTWLEALRACSALGPEWRLPRRFELSLYLASEPEQIRGWRGTAWTPVESEWGRNAVVVELAPRRSGSWRSNYVPWRDRSLCELDPLGQSARVVHDWFSETRPALCSAGADYEGLHVSTVQFIAEIRGSVVGGPEVKYLTRETEAATICIKPASPELPRLRHRVYPKEQEYLDAELFIAKMKSVCNPRAAESDAAACTAFGSEAVQAIAR
jgi:hypothetical protein